MTSKKIQPAHPKAVAPEAKDTEGKQQADRKTNSFRIDGRKSGRKTNAAHFNG